MRASRLGSALHCKPHLVTSSSVDTAASDLSVPITAAPHKPQSHKAPHLASPTKGSGDCPLADVRAEGQGLGWQHWPSCLCPLLLQPCTLWASSPWTIAQMSKWRHGIWGRTMLTQPDCDSESNWTRGWGEGPALAGGHEHRGVREWASQAGKIAQARPQPPVAANLCPACLSQGGSPRPAHSQRLL